MPLRPLADLPLRTRILTAIAIVLVPLFVTAAASVYMLQYSAGMLHHVVELPARKLEAAAGVQREVLKMLALVKDLPPRRNRDWREQLEAAVQHAGAGFEDILADPALPAPERALLSLARREWEHGLALGAGAEQQQRFRNSAYVLDAMHDVYRDEMDGGRARAERDRHRFLSALALVVGIGAAGGVAGGLVLTRSVLRSLRELEQGLEHVAHNDLSYRLAARRRDEFGRLAQEFNTAAEHLLAEHNRLEELSVRDGLTGLYNRREFDRRLHDEALRAQRYGRPYAVLMLDIDHFKLVNDHYGHTTGDEVLAAVADLLRLNVRPVDSVCRYGGEELAVILPETGEDGAAMVAERIRRTVAGAAIATPAGQTVRITVSIGVADSTQAGDSTDVVRVADMALYAAKREGRNRVRRH